ncbi:MAG: DUF928 domain-containing protein, partial [Symploca sp. SIO2E6]|nr:DUF928 domain-containing protein [Symploca sp. SIO2E6]
MEFYQGKHGGNAGSRGGCEGDGTSLAALDTSTQGIPLTLLAPQSHVGKTVATRLTFAWFVPDSTSNPMEFRIYEYNSNGDIQPIGEPISWESSPGIVPFTLPEEGSELKVGHTYMWQVTILCNPNNPSNDLIARGYLEVVEVPSDWEDMLFDRSTASDFYAAAGLWYDALGAALKLAEESRLGEFGSTRLEE